MRTVGLTRFSRFFLASRTLPALASVLLASVLHPSTSAAQDLPPDTAPKAAFTNHARRVYLDTLSLAEQHPDQAEVQARFARACFEWADYSDSARQREELALRGIEAARKSVALNPKLANGQYTLALNLGQLARTRTLTALKIVQEMETAFLKAIALDPHLDYSGPHRALGILYQDAPNWPVSIGNRKKAREHFDQAVKLHPDYPGNPLCLIEAFLKWNEADSATERLASTQRVLVNARKQLTGATWASSWYEWDQRWSTVTNRLGAF
jgi:tetratricopeptide (TPR) repeat protein